MSFGIQELNGEPNSGVAGQWHERQLAFASGELRQQIRQFPSLQYWQRVRCSVQTFLCLLCTARDSGNVLKSWRFRMRNVRPRYRNSGAFVHGTKFRNFSPIMEQGQSRVRRLYDFRTIEFHVTPCHSLYTVLWCLKLRYKYLWISIFFNHLHFFAWVFLPILCERTESCKEWNLHGWWCSTRWSG